MKKEGDMTARTRPTETEQRKPGFTEILNRGKKVPDTLGYKDIGGFYEPAKKPPTLEEPREGHNYKAGDLIAGSGMARIFEYLQSSGKITEKGAEIDPETDTTGKKTPDTFGYVYNKEKGRLVRLEEWERSDVIEGYHDRAGDLIAKSGSYKMLEWSGKKHGTLNLKEIESEDGKSEKIDKIVMDRIPMYKQLFIEGIINPFIPTLKPDKFFYKLEQDLPRNKVFGTLANACAIIKRYRSIQSSDCHWELKESSIAKREHLTNLIGLYMNNEIDAERLSELIKTDNTKFGRNIKRYGFEANS